MNADTQLTVRRAEAQEIPQVAEIFCAQFSGLVWTRLGKPFVRRLVEWHLKYHPELSLVAVEDGRSISGRITGFILGASQGHRVYYRQVLRYAYPEFLRGSLSHPWLFLNRTVLSQWADLIRKAPAERSGRDELSLSKTGEKKAVLCFVAVTEAVGKRGLGTRLVQAFEEAAFGAGAELLSSYTDIRNTPARKLHERCGWKLVREDTGHRMAYYSKRQEASL